jgi:hypothetical protein
LALDEMVSELATYRQSLPAAADYCPSNDEYDESEEDIVEAEEDE